MYDFKKLSSEKVKRLCSEAKIKSLSENDLAGLFGYVNSQLFRLNNARGLDAVMERQWWNAALALITEEVNRRGIQLMYVGIEKKATKAKAPSNF